jgi:hypothetical protein
MSDRGLRRGDLVEVRGAAEILETLDDRGALDAMPFMPEMVAYCGKRFTVSQRTDKVCDTIHNDGSRRVADAVFLDDLRCDGSAHGDCQAECRFYWKEAWLRPVAPADPVAPPNADDDVARAALSELVGTHATAGSNGDTRHRCQATDMVAASLKLSTMDPRPYLREYTSQNVSVRTFTRVMARAAVMQPLHKVGLLPSVPVRGTATKSPTAPPLQLQPGDWVRVKSKPQIEEMLTDKGMNKGLWFDREMIPFCGNVYRVRQRVRRIVDERTGKMIEFGTDCITLDGVVCSGELSTARWFCSRQIFPYWRECWLERVDGPNGS